MSVSAAQQASFGIGANSSQPSQFDVVHSTENFTVSVNGGTAQHRYYMGGIVGASNRLGNTADQIIQSLTRSVNADGTHPVGTIYFEENDDIRSNTRESQWPAMKSYLVAQGVSVIEESDTPGSTPRNRNNVRGAVTGLYELTLPNGSTYLPGSWADNLTSYGGNFSPGQTKATEFIAAGAAGTSGTVEEPFALASRFPHASIFGGIDSGLTLAESFYHSVADPDILQFFGDLLAQPYADLPIITLTSAPAENAVVSGTLTFATSTTLPAGSSATAVNRLELWVDGVLKSSATGGTASLNLNTTTLSDGMHEFRIVAIANNAAASESIAIRNLEVRNHSQRIQTGGTNYSGAANAVLSIPATTEAGGETIARVELRHLGRVVGSATGAAASISLPLSTLAFGENSISPAAVFADGSEVRGKSIRVTRNQSTIAGQSVTPVNQRIPGIRAEYFLNKGATSIAASNFTGTPDLTRTHRSLYIEEGPNADDQLATGNIDKLAIRFTGRFVVTEQNAGETLFSLIRTNDSARLSIDGQQVLAWNNLSYGYNSADSSATIRLGAGEHTFELLIANTGGGTDPGLNIDLRMRGTDGVTRIMNDQIAFTANSTTGILNPPQIIAPVAPTTAQRPQFSWVPAAGSVQTEIWINNLSTNTASVIHTTVNGTTFVPNQDLGIGKYRVWLRSVAADGRKSAWSPFRNFTINTPVTLNVLEPKQQTNRPTIAWQPLSGAVRYDIWINNLSTGQAAVVRNTNVEGTAFTPTQDLPIGRYRVWVRGIDAAGTAAQWSVAIDFQINVAPSPAPGFATTSTAAFFTHDFESLDTAAFNVHHTNFNGWNLPGAGGFTSVGYRTNMSLVETTDARSGSKALQVTYEMLEDRSQAEVEIPDGTDFVRSTQFMRFGATYDFARGQKIHRIRSVNPLTELNNFDIVVLAWGKPQVGRPEWDMTGMNDLEMLSINFNGGPVEWGAEWVNVALPREEWHKLETEIQLNTPGMQNGFVRLILNGVVIAEKLNIAIRDNAQHKINNVLFGGWYSNSGGGQNPAPNPATPTSLLIDDVRIETSVAPGTGQLATSTFDQTPEFRWTPSLGSATSEIFIRNINTGATVIHQRNLPGDAWTPTTDLADGPCRWWVASSTAQGFRSNWSTPIDFYIGGRPTLIGPAGTTTDRRPEFTWQPVGQARSYQLWVSRVDVPSVVINQSGLTQTQFRPATDLVLGRYRVWVRAVSPTGQLGPWSIPLDFRVA